MDSLKTKLLAAHPEMKSFLDKIDSTTFPAALLPMVELWAAHPLFDAKGHPYLALSADECKTHGFVSRDITYSYRCVPVVYNANYGGYTLNREITKLLKEASVWALLGKKIDRAREAADSEEKEYSGWNHGREISDLLPRHHLFLVAVVAFAKQAHKSHNSIITHLELDYIHSLCVNVYSISEYDGNESVEENPLVAIAKQAMKIPTDSTKIADALQHLRETIVTLQHDLHLEE